ncbi:MAG: hypothetical protein K2K77_09195, partial [Duncaniella sp.]|nr:hypothetical protein [Duncaniella sp.]
MTLRILPILLFTVPAVGLAQVSVSYSASGQTGQPIQISAPASTGLDQGIYVVPDTRNLRIAFSTSAPAGVKWFTFSNMGGAYAQELAPAGTDASSSWITPAAGDMGYIVEADGRSYYLWLVDYSLHPFK